LAVATGVQANLTCWDVARHAIADDRIEVVALLLEQLGPPTVWRPVLAAAQRTGKPVIICKAGRTGAGAAAIATHTGSIAGDWPAQRAALTDAGVYLAADLDQLWELAAVLVRFGHGPGRPPRLGVIAMSGGEGALIADQSDDAGLVLPPPAPAFGALVAENLTMAGAGNPFDPTGEVLGLPDRGASVLEGFVALHDFDVWLVAHNAQDGDTADVAAGLARLAAKEDKPLCVSSWPVAGLSDRFDAALAAVGVPLFRGSHRAIAALGAWGARRRLAAPVADGASDLPAPPSGATYWEARAHLAACGVPFAAAIRITTADGAVAAAAELGYPVVLKADVASTVHKAATGALRLGVRSAAAVARAFAELTAIDDVTGVVVEEQATGLVEVLVGIAHDADAGAVLAIGTGGTLVEELRDAALIPVDTAGPDRIAAALATTAVGRWLGKRPTALTVDVVRAAATVAALARHGVAVEINPLAVTFDRVVALDARIDAP
jgi:acyl-CoA synthetase (NDP forming)